MNISTDLLRYQFGEDVGRYWGWIAEIFYHYLEIG